MFFKIWTMEKDEAKIQQNNYILFGISIVYTLLVLLLDLQLFKDTKVYPQYVGLGYFIGDNLGWVTFAFAILCLILLVGQIKVYNTCKLYIVAAVLEYAITIVLYAHDMYRNLINSLFLFGSKRERFEIIDTISNKSFLFFIFVCCLPVLFLGTPSKTTKKTIIIVLSLVVLYYVLLCTFFK